MTAIGRPGHDCPSRPRGPGCSGPSRPRPDRASPKERLAALFAGGADKRRIVALASSVSRRATSSAYCCLSLLERSLGGFFAISPRSESRYAAARTSSICRCPTVVASARSSESLMKASRGASMDGSAKSCSCLTAPLLSTSETVKSLRRWNGAHGKGGGTRHDADFVTVREIASDDRAHRVARRWIDWRHVDGDAAVRRSGVRRCMRRVRSGLGEKGKRSERHQYCEVLARQHDSASKVLACMRAEPNQALRARSPSSHVPNWTSITTPGNARAATFFRRFFARNSSRENESDSLRALVRCRAPFGHLWTKRAPLVRPSARPLSFGRSAWNPPLIALVESPRPVRRRGIRNAYWCGTRGASRNARGFAHTTNQLHWRQRHDQPQLRRRDQRRQLQPRQ